MALLPTAIPPSPFPFLKSGQHFAYRTFGAVRAAVRSASEVTSNGQTRQSTQPEYPCAGTFSAREEVCFARTKNDNGGWDVETRNLESAKRGQGEGRLQTAGFRRQGGAEEERSYHELLASGH
jgi:hypothetical protein